MTASAVWATAPAVPSPMIRMAASHGRDSSGSCGTSRCTAQAATATAASRTAGQERPGDRGRPRAQHHRRHRAAVAQRERGRTGPVVRLPQPPRAQPGAVVVRDPRRRLVAHPPARAVQAQHEVDVLGDVHVVVESRADGRAADEQRRAGDVGDPGARHDDGRVRAQVQRRPHRLVPAQPAADRRLCRPATRRWQGDDPRAPPARRPGRPGARAADRASRGSAPRRSRGRRRAGSSRRPARRCARRPGRGGGRGVARGPRCAPAPRSCTAATRASGSADPSSTTITPPRSGRERGDHASDGVGPVLDRHDDGDVPRPGPRAVRNRVHHPAVEQPPGQCPGGGVGDREPAAGEQRAPGRGEPEHARGCAAEQHPPAVERDDVPVDDDAPPVGQDRVRRPGADVGRHTLRRLDIPRSWHRS